jgi:glycosyltransferase involved in cell wall biosynthesis
LIKQGHNIGLFCIGGSYDCSPDDIPIVESSIEQSRLFFPKAPSLRIWHQHDLSMHVGKGLHCGFPIFELNKFTDIERHHLSNLDILFVSSTWASNVVKQNNIDTSTVVIPFGVDTQIFMPNRVVSNANTTIFLNIGKWEIRKGHDIIVKAFNQAFLPSDDVHLIMHCHNPFLSNVENTDWARLYLNSKLGKAGRTIKQQRLKSQQEIAFLMNQVDCGVFPSRAEGWNLESLEMMACGLPVITTDYSAHTEYATNDNAMLVKVNQLEPAFDNKWFFNQGEWAKLDKDVIEQIVQYMRTVHKIKQENGSIPLNAAGIQTAHKFSWDVTANGIVRELSNV